MGTRGQLAGLVALTLLSAGAACKPLQLDLALGDGAAADPPGIPCSNPGPCANTGTPFCELEAGVCVECLTSDVCPKNRRHCLGNVCVSCTQDSDCNDGGTGSRMCNREIPRCTTPCTAEEAGACRSMGPGGTQEACAIDYGYCVECTEKADQSSECMMPPHIGGTHCFGLPTGACGCLDDGDCPDGGHCGPAIGPSQLRFCAAPALLL
jgi:hypothetical protein